MKNVKDKFKKKINFVKPLYRKVNAAKKPTSNVTVDIDNSIKLCDNKISVTRHIKQPNYSLIKSNNKISKVFKHAGANLKKNDNDKRRYCDSVLSNVKMNNFVTDKITATDAINHAELMNRNKVYKSFATWLRMCPAPRLQNESVWSVAIRWVMSQLGLALFISLWTLSWMVVIQYFEGPYEQKVSQDFLRAQNQLVIELATELRQIAPLSPKWRKAIEDRMEAERRLTVAAVEHGARLQGHFWDYPGTFLIMIYVMTALGFGAPMPQTMGGRMAMFVYAVVAVPVYLFLMVHLSKCVVVHAENFTQRIAICYNEKRGFEDKHILDNNGSSNNSGNSEMVQTKRSLIRRIIICILQAICVGHGIPLAIFMYYLLGAAVFGLARSKTHFEDATFPVKFTAGEGLEHVKSYLRILYGLYLVGAVILLSCALAAICRHSSGPANKMAAQYRLFASENSRRSETTE